MPVHPVIPGGGGSSIGGTVSGGTEGSVLFLGVGGILAQDNANFFLDNTDNRLGIGTNTFADPITGSSKVRIVDGTFQVSIRDHASGQGYITTSNGTITGFVGQTNSTTGFTMGSYSAHKVTILAGLGAALTLQPTSLDVEVSGGNLLVPTAGKKLAVGTSSFTDPILGADGSNVRFLAGTQELSFAQNSNQGYLAISNGTITGFTGHTNTTDGFVVGSYTNHPFVIRTNNTRAITVDTSQNVGIGEVSPGARLQVNTGAAGTIGQIIKGAASQSANLQEWRDSAGALQTAISPTGQLLITNSGAYRSALFTGDANNALTFSGSGAYGSVGLVNGVLILDTSQFIGTAPAAAFQNGLAYFSDSTNLYGTGEVNAEIAPSVGHPAIHALARGAAASTDYALYVTSGASYTDLKSRISFDGSAYFLNSVGFNTTAPDKQVEINHATGQNLRLTYNDANGSAANYVDFTTSSSGDLTITPSGGDVTIAGTLALSSNQDAGTFMQFSNTNAGSSAFGGVKLTTDGGDSYLYRTSIAYGSSLGDDTVLQDAGGGDVVIFGTGEVARFLNGGGVTLATGTLTVGGNVQPATDDTYYLGRNDDDSPKAWKGVILKDQTTGTYYRLQIDSGVVTVVDLSD